MPAEPPTTLADYLRHPAVIGAAGKMGRGIALLLLLDMLRPDTEGARDNRRLTLIDPNADAHSGLADYLRKQLTRVTEQRVDPSSGCGKDRGDRAAGTEEIAATVDATMASVAIGTELGDATDATMVFEAISEDIDLKCDLLRQLRSLCRATTVFLTNTSSVPIALLNESASLDDRIIGFHFYNPPPVQKLLELIPLPPPGGDRVAALGRELVKRLGKTVVTSNDVAGFIGNGHFMREIRAAMEGVNSLADEFRDFEAVYVLDRVTRNFLLRPMGIMQLMDYVGVDVCRAILKIMDTCIDDESFTVPLVEELVHSGITGGQYDDGNQKDGLLKYEDNRPAGVYSTAEDRYVMFADGNWRTRCDDRLGPVPDEGATWRSLRKAADRDDRIGDHFQRLSQSDTMGANLARANLLKSREIARGLVRDGVARDIADVNKVLRLGFHHLYDADNEHLSQL